MPEGPELKIMADYINHNTKTKKFNKSFPEGTPRKTIVDAYEQYLLSNKELMNDLHELKDKVLGCWCKDLGGRGKSCHGDILVKWVKKTCD